MPRLPTLMSLMLPGNSAIDGFFNACANESVEDPLEIKDPQGYSILSLAVQIPNGGVVVDCLKRINKYYGEALARSKVAALRDTSGKTPLFIAAGLSNSETGVKVIQALCAAGVDPNVQALRSNKTALHEANANTIPALLDCGANPSVCDVDGNNPLACAFINYNPGAAKAMLDYFEKKINKFGEASALDTSQQQFLDVINKCMQPETGGGKTPWAAAVVMIAQLKSQIASVLIGSDFYEEKSKLFRKMSVNQLLQIDKDALETCQGLAKRMKNISVRAKALSSQFNRSRNSSFSSDTQGHTSVDDNMSELSDNGSEPHLGK